MPESRPPPGSPEALESLLRDVLARQGAWSDREYLWLTVRTGTGWVRIWW